ncbi:dna-binding sap [Pyrenophora seminiperda CCB06]|uniref:Dna-binding sap n=1 Tax=Pyrenophora seminiperda CCB06 TaxID=1302712 RepID=A0A3M7M460_9PLEO|nr:dna-binding sap [Pyrenophora seminiperda CCB06]
MAPKARTVVTAKALQALLTRIGAPSSGTKAILQARFLRELTQSRLSNHPKTASSQEPLAEKKKKKLRIMSIDMGIKNLAFCEAEISYPVKGSLDATMHVVRWDKINLVPTKKVDLESSLLVLDAENEEADMSMDKTADVDAEEEEDVQDPYSSATLSKTAYALVKNTILAADPDIILIEKQRWRSGGGSAVQQWTLRVNTLEGMLWAILHTLYAERMAMPKTSKKASSSSAQEEGLYSVFGVDPKRVGNYWLGEQDIERLARAEASSSSSSSRIPAADTHISDSDSDTEADTTPLPPPNIKKPSRSKAEKRAKIALLRTWLSSSSASTTTTSITTPKNPTPTLSFTIGPHAQPALQALLCSPPLKKKPLAQKRKTTPTTTDAKDVVVGPAEMKKLDDITDCFLQAAAWVSWEANRRQLCEVLGERWGRMKDDEGVVAELVRFMMDGE